MTSLEGFVFKYYFGLHGSELLIFLLLHSLGFQLPWFNVVGKMSLAWMFGTYLWKGFIISVPCSAHRLGCNTMN